MVLVPSLVLSCVNQGGGGAGSAGADSAAGGGPLGQGGASDSAGGATAGSGAGTSSWTGSAGASPVADVFPPEVTAPRLMIVGDSISAGPGCYKKYLLQALQEDGYSFEFVGEYTDDCGGGVRHSAVSCTTSSNYTRETFTVANCFPDKEFPGMAPLVASHNPDMILLQLGVNDVWGGRAPIQPILDNYTELVAQARAHNPRIAFVVAQIHKIKTDSCSNEASTDNARQLVEAVPAWAEGISTADSPVFVADLWTNSDSNEADDCVHPNDAGAQRMGQNWYEALKNLLPRD